MVYRKTERSEKVRQASRSRFLNAARKLFRLQGYQGTTIQEIVREAASSVGNLYFYFRNKEALLKAVVEDAFELIWKVGEEAMSTFPQGPGRLVVLQHVNVLAVYRHPDLAELVLSDQYPSLVELIESIQEPRFRRVLSENIGLIPEEEQPLAVAAWAGAARNVMLQKLKKGLDIDAADLSRYIARFNLRALGLDEEEIERALAAIGELDSEALAERVDALRAGGEDHSGGDGDGDDGGGGDKDGAGDPN